VHVSRTFRWLLFFCGALASARTEAAGVVGTGTPASCTQAALNAALAGGGTVTFDCGAGAVIPITSTKTLTSTTTIDGTGQTITLDGGGTTRLFNTTYQFASFTLTFRNLTLRNGFAADFGGAIRLAYQDFLTTLVIENVTFSNNVCSQAGNDVGGGALYAQGGIVTIRNSTFLNNRGGNGGAIGNLQARFTIEDTLFQGNATNANVGGGGTGGAIYVDGSNNGQLVLRRTTFRSNTAAFMGGAIHTYQYAGASGMTIEDSLFENNVTDRNGGAIYHQNGSLTIARSTFSGNVTRGQGGALWLLQATPTAITNSTFTGNRANGIPPNNGSSGLGGAILINASTIATITHTTIANNHADWVGGAITGGMSSGSSTTLRASLVANNTAANGGNPWNIGRNCSSQLVEGGGNIQFPARNPNDPSDRNCTAAITIADPLLLPLAANGGPTPTRAIPSNSLARNFVASGCPPPSTDQRGVARSSPSCDAGSYEAINVGLGGVPNSIEGTGGTATLTFGAMLSAASPVPVTVAYATGDEPGAAYPATAGSDYVASSGVLTIPPNTIQGAIVVPLVTDSLDENDEAFRVTLSSPVGALIGSASGTGIIVDDDPAPLVFAGADCVGVEGTGAGGTCPLTIGLSTASGKQVTVAYATANGTATAPADYASAAGVVTFPPGVASRSLTLALAGDAVDEVDEAFVVNLTAPTNATLGDAQGSVTIDDDDGPLVVVTGPSVAEGNAGTSNASFALALSSPSVQPVLVPYGTADGTAVAGADYETRFGVVTFPPGATAQSVVVPVVGDTLDEPNETFHLGLGPATDATVSAASSLATVVDDDGGAITLVELSHGVSRRSVPDAAGSTLFVLSQPAWSSWEIVLDEASGDLGAGAGGPALERLAPDLSTVLQASASAGAGFARSLRWQNSAGQPHGEYVRVRATGCTTTCGPDDTYRVRAYETTVRVPRFNAAAGQATSLVIQNLGTQTVAATAFFWRADGMLLASQSFTVGPRALHVLGAGSVPGVAGASGSVTITHDGRHGDLVGKSVSIDPGPGFAFDTPFVTRPR
jgi:hypothetical protein